MSSKAAERVFAVPELLENIIFQLADTVDPTSQKMPYPAVSLFGVLRVNKPFRDTIEGSLKLKRVMFLAPIEPEFRDHESYCQHGAPLAWLHDKVLSPESYNVEPGAWGQRDREADT